MGFFDDAAADALEIIAELGQDVTYTANGGSPATVKALWSPQSKETPGPVNKGMQTDRGVVQLHEDDAPNPDTRDAFEIGGVKYLVEAIATSRPLVVFRVVAFNEDSSRS